MAVYKSENDWYLEQSALPGPLELTPGQWLPVLIELLLKTGKFIGADSGKNKPEILTKNISTIIKIEFFKLIKLSFSLNTE